MRGRTKNPEPSTQKRNPEARIRNAPALGGGTLRHPRTRLSGSPAPRFGRCRRCIGLPSSGCYLLNSLFWVLSSGFWVLPVLLTLSGALSALAQVNVTTGGRIDVNGGGFVNITSGAADLNVGGAGLGTFDNFNGTTPPAVPAGWAATDWVSTAAGYNSTVGIIQNIANAGNKIYTSSTQAYGEWEFRFKFNSASAGVMRFYFVSDDNGGSNSYYIEVSMGVTDYIRLIEKVGGTPQTPMAEPSFTADTNWYRVRIYRRPSDGSFNAYLYSDTSGTQVASLSGIDTSLGSSSNVLIEGPGTGSETVTIDDIQTDGGRLGTVNLTTSTSEVWTSGTVRISALSSLVCTNSPKIYVQGNWSNSGTFTPATSTVYFIGTGSQTIDRVNSGSSMSQTATFNNVQVGALANDLYPGSSAYAPTSVTTVSSISNDPGDAISCANLTLRNGTLDLDPHASMMVAHTVSGGNLTVNGGTLKIDIKANVGTLGSFNLDVGGDVTITSGSYSSTATENTTGTAAVIRCAGTYSQPAGWNFLGSLRMRPGAGLTKAITMGSTGGVRILEVWGQASTGKVSALGQYAVRTERIVLQAGELSADGADLNPLSSQATIEVRDLTADNSGFATPTDDQIIRFDSSAAQDTKLTVTTGTIIAPRLQNKLSPGTASGLTVSVTSASGDLYLNASDPSDESKECYGFAYSGNTVTHTLSAGTIYLAGHWEVISTNTFNAGGTTVIFNGTASQTIRHSPNSDTGFYSLTMNNTGGAVVWWLASTSVRRTLTLTQGTFWVGQGGMINLGSDSGDGGHTVASVATLHLDQAGSGSSTFILTRGDTLTVSGTLEAYRSSPYSPSDTSEVIFTAVNGSDSGNATIRVASGGQARIKHFAGSGYGGKFEIMTSGRLVDFSESDSCAWSLDLDNLTSSDRAAIPYSLSNVSFTGSQGSVIAGWNTPTIWFLGGARGTPTDPGGKMHWVSGAARTIGLGTVSSSGTTVTGSTDTAGTITSIGTAVTGSGTSFDLSNHVGRTLELTSGAQLGQRRTIVSQSSATSITIDSAFSVDQSSATNYKIYRTNFASSDVGKHIIASNQTRTVLSVDETAQTLVTNTAFSPALSGAWYHIQYDNYGAFRKVDGTIESNGTTVTGTGTNFVTSAFNPNNNDIEMVIYANKEWRLITAVAGITSLTIESAFSSNLSPGTSYAIAYPTLRDAFITHKDVAATVTIRAEPPLALNDSEDINGLTTVSNTRILENMIFAPVQPASGSRLALSDGDALAVSRVTLRNCIVARGGLDEITTENGTVYPLSGSTALTFTNNGTPKNTITLSGATTTVDAEKNITVAATDADTYFLSRGSLDFHLKSTAANALNTGQALTLASDYEGQTRPNGGGWDVGADEYYQVNGSDVARVLIDRDANGYGDGPVTRIFYHGKRSSSGPNTAYAASGNTLAVINVDSLAVIASTALEGQIVNLTYWQDDVTSSERVTWIFCLIDTGTPTAYGYADAIQCVVDRGTTVGLYHPNQPLSDLDVYDRRFGSVDILGNQTRYVYRPGAAGEYQIQYLSLTNVNPDGTDDASPVAEYNNPSGTNLTRWLRGFYVGYKTTTTTGGAQFKLQVDPRDTSDGGAGTNRAFGDEIWSIKPAATPPANWRNFAWDAPCTFLWGATSLHLYVPCRNTADPTQQGVVYFLRNTLTAAGTTINYWQALAETLPEGDECAGITTDGGGAGANLTFCLKDGPTVYNKKQGASNDLAGTRWASRLPCYPVTLTQRIWGTNYALVGCDGEVHKIFDDMASDANPKSGCLADTGDKLNVPTDWTTNSSQSANTKDLDWPLTCYGKPVGKLWVQQNRMFWVTDQGLIYGYTWNRWGDSLAQGDETLLPGFPLSFSSPVRSLYLSTYYGIAGLEDGSVVWFVVWP